jgi:hypothetical protein
MELFEALYVERWLQGKGPSKAIATAYRYAWQRLGNFEAQRPFHGNGKGHFEGKDPSHNHSSLCRRTLQRVKAME